ncbi:unnamed protein product (macronuclear) [Paramecium tetraurelia]|uniref:t-SNARE coiled-coil homology domain-containing protein n=1 Tax=Paramecium tetraurelia TaxID=5888 RepID=A0DH54_PARTE|nr:uncharacterized protein GSPATT00016757001 [Paramecium tetraurelia]CAK82371.1 unnamed protein product [Paramecium tetraurelia]|eukprot:XP_001449768.1 hypothetical protein (macronuclear) [Paramecium tetraurelia strain d4-2]
MTLMIYQIKRIRMSAIPVLAKTSLTCKIKYKFLQNKFKTASKYLITTQDILQVDNKSIIHLNLLKQQINQLKFYKKEIDIFFQACKLLEQQLQQKRKTMTANSSLKQNDPKLKPIDDLQEQFMHNYYDIESQIIREKGENVQKLALNVQMLNKVLEDVAFQVDLADKPPDLVAENQETTKINLVDANVELVKAQDSQKSANKKLIIIASLMAILVGVLIIILIYNWK